MKKFVILFLLTIFFIFMIENWGALQKSATDDETIEQAIDRLIAVHESAATSHLGAGESLQSHKNADVIDHPADSVVSDKVPDFSILKEKLTTNKDYLSTNFESLDFWNLYVPADVYTNFGQMNIYTDGVTNHSNQVLANGDPFAINFSAKNPVFEMLVKVPYTTSQLVYFGVGSGIPTGTDNFMGFKVSNGSLYACWMGGGAERTQIINGVTITNFHTYKAVMTSGSKIEFYIDDVLVYTATTNLPNNAEDLCVWDFYVKETTASYRALYIKGCTFYQDR